MAVASVASHGERHVNPLAEQRQERQSAATTVAKENAGNNAVSEDTYTPSAADNSAQATAQAAGIFQFNPAAVASTNVLAQPPLAANQDGPAPQPAPIANASADPVQTSTATNAGSSGNATQLVAGAPASQTAALATAGNTDVQSQVQALNNALAALGLSRYDIQQIDRIATVIQNFNPSAYTDLVNQFQERAQPASQLAAPPVGTNGNNAENLAANSKPGAAVNAGYQLRGISVTYAALPAATGPGAAKPQIQQVQITLTGGTGQTIQVQAPRQSTDAGTPSAQGPQAHIQAA